MKSFKRAFINKIQQTADFSDYRLLQTMISRTGFVVSYYINLVNINENTSNIKIIFRKIESTSLILKCSQI